MTLSADSRTRGGMLILALAFIGGTGCVAIDAVNKNRDERQQRDAEAARQRRIAELAGAAAAGNPAARTSLAYTLVSTRDRKQADVPRALDLLEQLRVAPLRRSFYGLRFEKRKAITKLDDHALGEFLADARDRYQTQLIASLDCTGEFIGGNSRQNVQRKFRSDAGNAVELQENLFFRRLLEAEKL